MAEEEEEGESLVLHKLGQPSIVSTTDTSSCIAMVREKVEGTHGRMPAVHRQRKRCCSASTLVGNGECELSTASLVVCEAPRGDLVRPLW